MGEKIPARWQRLRDAYTKLTTECDRLKERNKILENRDKRRDKHLHKSFEIEIDRLKDENEAFKSHISQKDARIDELESDGYYIRLNDRISELEEALEKIKYQAEVCGMKDILRCSKEALAKCNNKE